MSLRQVHFATVDLELHARFQPGQVGAAACSCQEGVAEPHSLALLRGAVQASPGRLAHSRCCSRISQRHVWVATSSSNPPLC